MADFNGMLRTTIDDYLLALAEGLVNAQSRLDQAVIGGNGRDRFTYTIPRVDFELRLMMDVSSETRTTSPNENALVTSPYAPVVLLRPLSGSESTMRASAELASTIRGSFVAVPINDSRAAVVLRASVGPKSGAVREVLVTVTKSTGEAQPGVAVEVNLDKDRSATLSTAAGITWSAPQAGTFVEQGLLVTGADGTAKTTLFVDGAEPKGAILLVALDVRGASDSVAVKVD
jgi:hypothetical protein